MFMSDEKLNQIIENEKEWRRALFKKVESIETELHDFKVEQAKITTTLKVKIGFFGAAFGFIGGLVPTLLSFFQSK